MYLETFDGNLYLFSQDVHLSHKTHNDINLCVTLTN